MQAPYPVVPPPPDNLLHHEAPEMDDEPGAKRQKVAPQDMLVPEKEWIAQHPVPVARLLARPPACPLMQSPCIFACACAFVCVAQNPVTIKIEVGEQENKFGWLLNGQTIEVTLPVSATVTDLKEQLKYDSTYLSPRTCHACAWLRSADRGGAWLAQGATRRHASQQAEDTAWRQALPQGHGHASGLQLCRRHRAAARCARAWPRQAMTGAMPFERTLSLTYAIHVPPVPTRYDDASASLRTYLLYKCTGSVCVSLYEGACGVPSDADDELSLSMLMAPPDDDDDDDDDDDVLGAAFAAALAVAALGGAKVRTRIMSSMRGSPVHWRPLCQQRPEPRSSSGGQVACFSYLLQDRRVALGCQIRGLCTYASPGPRCQPPSTIALARPPARSLVPKVPLT